MFRFLVNHFLRGFVLQNKEAIIEKAAKTVRESDLPFGRRGEVPLCRVAIVFSSEAEAGGLLDKLKSKVRTECNGFVEHVGKLNDLPVSIVVVEESDQALDATRETIRLHSPQWVIASGFLQALTDSLKQDDTVMATALCHKDQSPLTIDLKASAGQRLHVGKIVTVNRLPTTPAARSKMADSHNVIAADTIAYHVAVACTDSAIGKNETRFMAVHAVGFEIDELPVSEQENIRQQQSLAGKMGAATGAVFNRPGSVKDFWKASQRSTIATDRLARVLSSTIDRLMQTSSE